VGENAPAERFAARSTCAAAVAASPNRRLQTTCALIGFRGLRGCLKSPEMSVFDRCRAISEGAPIALSPLKSIMPIFPWLPCQAARGTFQTASYTPIVSEKRNLFLRPLKNKVFQESGVTTIGLYDIGKSTTLESNKSLTQTRPRPHGGGTAAGGDGAASHDRHVLPRRPPDNPQIADAPLYHAAQCGTYSPTCPGESRQHSGIDAEVHEVKRLP